MRTLLVSIILLASGAAWAATPVQAPLGYNFAELRFVDADNNGDGLRLNGSYRFSGNWLAIGSLTTLDYGNSVDSLTVEAGVGYVWPYRDSWDLTGNARIIRVDVDTPVGSADETGFGLTGGVRGMIAPSFEVNGAAHYVDVADSDIYLEVGGDYYFTQNFAAGLSIEFAGEADALTLGASWYFR